MRFTSLLKAVSPLFLIAGVVAATGGTAQADDGRRRDHRDHRDQRYERRDHDNRQHQGRDQGYRYRRDDRHEVRRPVVVRDHRNDVVYHRPHRAPPVRRFERVRPRPGYLWVSGRYDWRNNDYAWVDGYWQQEQPNRRWIEGRWDLGVDGFYVWVDGYWQDLAPVVVVQPAPRPGLVWIDAHWSFRHGRQVWVAGHWERARNHRRW